MPDLPEPRRGGAARPRQPAGEAGHRARVLPADASTRSARPATRASSRDPVTDYDEQTVEQVGRRLKDRGLLRIVWSDTGPPDAEVPPDPRRGARPRRRRAGAGHRAAARGPQAPGELRTRTDRLHAFADRAASRRRLPGWPAGRPLVRELPRRSGDRDARWVHLLGDAARERPAPTTPAPGRPRQRAGRRRRGARRRGCGRRTTPSPRRTPRTWSTSWPAAVRELAAGPGRRARGGRPGRRGRLRPRPHHGVPRRRRRGRDRHRPVAGDGRRGAAPVPGRHLRGRRPAPADAADRRATAGPPCSRGTR